ncbi:MAG: hypothetical protein GXO24_02685 [Chlorobi bacterium]|nr:hypothetical protein [Chlorobiota bacterium]
MKKIGLLLLTFWWMISPAQEIREVTDDQAYEAVRALNNTVLHVLENYFFYLQGVDPEHTSAQLDESIALSQNHLLTLEQYTLRHPGHSAYFQQTAAYWTGIRNKCVHTPVKGMEQKLLQYYDRLAQTLRHWAKQIKPGMREQSPSEMLPDYAAGLHYLSLLYILYERTGDTRFKTLLEAKLSIFNVRNNKFWSMLFNNEKADKSRLNELASRIRRFRKIIRKKQTEPEDVYTESFAITEGLEKLINLTSKEH